MTKGFVAAVIASVVFLAAGSLQAHHSLAGVYDLNKEVVLEGRLKKLNFTNPHASIELEVPNKDAKKTTTTWVLPFEIASVLLTAALVGAIMLARTPEEEAEDGLA